MHYYVEIIRDMNATDRVFRWIFSVTVIGPHVNRNEVSLANLGARMGNWGINRHSLRCHSKYSTSVTAAALRFEPCRKITPHLFSLHPITWTNAACVPFMTKICIRNGSSFKNWLFTFMIGDVKFIMHTFTFEIVKDIFPHIKKT